MNEYKYLDNNIMAANRIIVPDDKKISLHINESDCTLRITIDSKVYAYPTRETLDALIEQIRSDFNPIPKKCEIQQSPIDTVCDRLNNIQGVVSIHAFNQEDFCPFIGVKVSGVVILKLKIYDINDSVLTFVEKYTNDYIERAKNKDTPTSV
jgi:hypothetical protein